MTAQQILFIIAGTVTLGASLMVVTRRNVSRAALFLILAFFGVGGLFLLLEAPFLSVVQLLICIGGIATLIIFTAQFTRNESPEGTANRQWIAAALVAVALCSVLVWTILSYEWTAPADPVPERSIAVLGAALTNPRELALPFGVSSALLLVALIGAATFAKTR
jgi:NADH-quinone oxidoreductase subunit J